MFTYTVQYLLIAKRINKINNKQINTRIFRSLLKYRVTKRIKQTAGQANVDCEETKDERCLLALAFKPFRSIDSIMSQSKPMPGQLIPESTCVGKQIADINKSTNKN